MAYDQRLADEERAHWVCVKMRDDALAEVKRLRAALQRIVDEAESDDGLTAWDGSDIARQALNEQKTP